MNRPETTLILDWQTERIMTDKHTGQRDVALTGPGERQAKALGEMFEGAEFDRVWSRPLGRGDATVELGGLADVAEIDTHLPCCGPLP